MDEIEPTEKDNERLHQLKNIENMTPPERIEAQDLMMRKYLWNKFHPFIAPIIELVKGKRK